MYLINLLFQVIIGIMLIVFIISTMIGLYSNLSFSGKISGDSPKCTEKVDEQINVEIIQDEHNENMQKLSVETELPDLNYTEAEIQIEELTDNKSTKAESTTEDEVNHSTEVESNLDIKEEIATSKPSNKKYKKKRS